MLSKSHFVTICTIAALTAGCSSADKGSVTPEYMSNTDPIVGADPEEASDLSREELDDGTALPHFDEDGYYEMVEIVRFEYPPVPPTAATVPAPTDLEVSLMIEPTLADACGLPKPGVKFETDSAKVKESKHPMLTMLALCLQMSPLDDDRLVITGYADPRGTEYYNRELGLDRANAVGEALIESGLAKSRFDTYSRGESMASEDPEDWSKDRRVSIRLDR
ncbi:MAG: OmpA family protein [Nannocystaceae bacterium]|nr:OmpA family protein [bacterium]